MRHDYRMSEADTSAGGYVSGASFPENPSDLRGRFLYNEPMKKHVSWRAGGLAQRVYIPADLEDLCVLVRALPAEEPIHIFGLGSNLLVRDGGLPGISILLHGVLKKIALESRVAGLPSERDDTALVYAEAGVASPKLARYCANHNLTGGEFWAGIPGTVGGALAMNAGCYGHETWEKVAQVVTLNRDGQLRERRPEDYVTGYRHVALRVGVESGLTTSENSPHPNPLPSPQPSPSGRGSEGWAQTDIREGANAGLCPPKPIEEWFIGAWFRLPKGDGVASRLIIKDLLQKRIATQPLQQPNAGSVFRNPPGDYAARLIESCGLKGYRIGDAQVSPKHANFIVNLGKATAADIEGVIEHVETTVEALTNIRLLREVRIVGERN